MNILNDVKAQQALDKSNLYGSTEGLSKQVSHAWEDCQLINVPKSYQDINKIVMAGMGGSGLGARVIESIYGNSLKYPLIRVNEYDLPAWVDNKTLVICSSYSGNTEEIINTAKQAIARKTKWMAINAGGTLFDLAQKHQVPNYKINPIYNPSKQPRMAIAYSIVGQLVLASKAGLINLKKADIDQITKTMQKIVKQCQRTIADKNPAKQTAQFFYQKEIIFVASRHLTGAGHVVKNQMNENAKNLGNRHDVPELNHHLMEGLQHPDANRKDLVFWFLNSNLYPEIIQKRMHLTKDVVEKNKVKTNNWQATSQSKLAQAFEFIQFGGFVNYYLTMLYGIDPAPVPWVDYFKTKLGQPLGDWK